MKSPTALPSSEIMPHMVQLDGLRAICLLSIVFHHWVSTHVKIPVPFEIGAFIFFSLSGYLITKILLRGRVKITEGSTDFWLFLRSFSVRRALRLLPPYFCALLLYVILFNQEVLSNFWWYATNSSNILFARLGEWPGGADQFWSLAVDQQFYLAWPFLVLLFPLRSLPVFFLLIAGLAPLSRYLAYSELSFFSGKMDDKLPWFLTDHLCLGALLAYLQESRTFPSRFVLWIGALSSLFFYGMMRVASHDGDFSFHIWQQTLLALFSTCLVGLCVRGVGGLGKFLLEHPITQYVGTRSYGYYLYHNLAILLLGKFCFFLFPSEGESDSYFLLRLVLSALILWGLAHFSWLYLERPLLQRKKQHPY